MLSILEVLSTTFTNNRRIVLGHWGSKKRISTHTTYTNFTENFFTRAFKRWITDWIRKEILLITLYFVVNFSHVYKFYFLQLPWTFKELHKNLRRNKHFFWKTPFILFYFILFCCYFFLGRKVHETFGNWQNIWKSLYWSSK